MNFHHRVFLFLVVAIATTLLSFDAWAWTPTCGNPRKSAVTMPFAHDMLYRTKTTIGNNACLFSSAVSSPVSDFRNVLENGDTYDFYNDNDSPFNCDLDHCGEFNEEEILDQREKLSQLVDLLHAEPKGLLRFENDIDNGIRGIYLNQSIKNGEVLLKLPLDSCLRGDGSPSWLDEKVKKDPHGWATRLAATWAESYLKEWAADHTDRAQTLWSSLLPHPEYLRATLPVHWPEKTILSARSTALELAVDNAYFARAAAVEDLVRGFRHSPYSELFSKDRMTMTELAHHALDLVQTRSCLLKVAGEDLHVLAPIFDFINHGSAKTDSANACFSLEDQVEGDAKPKKWIVVRSLKDIPQDEEVKLDYGVSARPAWNCLLSYGFVPEYKQGTDGENLAEVYMKGVRYEVGDDSVPIDMVADATPKQWIEEDSEVDTISPPRIVLTSEIALRIAERIADAAYYLLLEPEQILLEDTDSETEPFEIISSQLAAKLRWSQHRILLTCAAGLAQFANEHHHDHDGSYQ